jgi:hypothetical protein
VPCPIDFLLTQKKERKKSKKIKKCMIFPEKFLKIVLQNLSLYGIIRVSTMEIVI